MTRCSILIMSDGARYLPSLRYSSNTIMLWYAYCELLLERLDWVQIFIKNWTGF